MADREAGAGWKTNSFWRRASFFMGLLKIYGSLYKNVDVLLFLRVKTMHTYTHVHHLPLFRCFCDTFLRSVLSRDMFYKKFAAFFLQNT